jgi:beta-1,4-mannosyl-glycoprotein beta-1,4-N-acetylglucosaminyltransferase
MIYDAFSFYNEFDVLRKRLAYMYSHVDKFVLVESSVTHSGQPKELLFEKNKDDFAEFADKIIHIKVEDNPTDANPWCRENHQRNCITRGLVDAKDDDVVLISDVDEIPNVNIIKMFIDHNILTASVHMFAFQYSFKYYQEHEAWFGTVITRKKYVAANTPQAFRDKRWSFKPFQHGGWHLSSFGDASHVYNKIKTFAHCNDGIHPTQTKADFDKIVDGGLWTDGKSKLPLTPESVLKTLPPELYNHDS